MFKRKPISGEAKPKDQLDLIDYQIYSFLSYLKIALFVLIIYLLTLTLSEMVFTWDTITESIVGKKQIIIPKGRYFESWQYPKRKINDVGVGVKNFGFKNQTNTLRLFAVDANVTEEL